MAYISEREKALSLRKKGFGISEIAEKITMSKSSVSLWCKDVKLSRGQIDRLEKRKLKKSLQKLFLYSERKRNERLLLTEKLTDEGIVAVGKIDDRDLFILGLGLYWAEGYKKGNEELGFTNSNPFIIKLFIRWLEKVYSVNTSDLILRISINTIHEDRVEIVLDYWSRLLKISKSQFTKTSLIKTISKKIYGNRENHFGTLRVKVRRGTILRRKILGSIKGLEKQA